jgi:hypothetical protein
METTDQRSFHQICAQCGGEMRYEVRQQDGKWLVWDTVNDCAVKGAASLPRLTAANCMRHSSIAGLLVMKPNSVTFWTQKEAQGCADFLNDIEDS